MRELQEIIRQHKEKYPHIQPQDLVKLVYQNEFGPGHFVEDLQVSLQRLAKEYQGITVQKGISPVEPIGNGLCRYYLWGISETELETLNRIFVLTANKRKGDVEAFERKLMYVHSLLPQMNFEFSEKEYEDYVRAQKEKGYPAVSHSGQYRENYQPSYRVIDVCYASFLDLLVQLEEQRKKNPTLVVGIDGNAAAGKTTLARCLSELYDCDIIHMDDFFLPLALRTDARMAQTGGNIHYERFREEVVEGIRRGEEFEYKVYSCHDMDYVGKKKADNQKMIVVEGVYAMREDFRDIYDYKIFMKLSEREQQNRIMERNGEEMYRIFSEKWIPMENQYFEEYQIESICDYIYVWQ